MNYTAVASRDGRWWLVHIPQIDQYTQARNLAEVEPMARDLIALCLNVAQDSFEIDVQVELPEVVSHSLKLAAEYRDAAAQANAHSAVEYRNAAKALKALGLTVRDVGVALNVSFQRAQQLLTTAN